MSAIRRCVLPLALVGLVALAGTVQADACAAEATTLRAHLERERARASTWNTSWAIAYGSVVIGQLLLVAAEYKPFGDFDPAYRDTLLVGATKATIGVGARVVLPLKLRVPAPLPDACAEVAQLRAALADAGRRERRSFFLNHLGGLAVNLSGAAYLWHEHDLQTAAISVGTGVVAGILAAYTQPRRSWHQWRERKATWAVAPVGTGWGVTLSW